MMRHGIRAGGALAVTLAATLSAAVPAQAQAQAQPQGVNEDVRCLLLSASFARLAKDDNSRRGSAMTGAFYLGRLDGRIGKPALTAAIRAQGKGLPAKEAETAMRTCAARATAAEQQMSALTRSAATGK
ncbi:MAG: hypothetical protein PGN08_09130 [Sphingomonas taxi]